MTVPGVFTEAGIGELIEDCSALPADLCARREPVIPRPAPAWEVSDECQARGAQYDAYA